MSVFTLDASVALAWLLGEEHDSGADIALRRLEQEEALVPDLWHLEVRNGLLAAMRRGRLADDDRQNGSGPCAISLSGPTGIPISKPRSSLAERHTLSFCDAIYLELAGRHRVPFATLDKALARAAAACGLPLVCDPAGAG